MQDLRSSALKEQAPTVAARVADGRLPSTLGQVRGWLLGLLALQLIGTFADLLLMSHYEDATQFVPLVLIVVALLHLGWHLVRPSPGTVRLIQVLMCMFVLAGLVGVGLHVQGAAAFQREIDPAQSTWTLLQKAVRAQAPPALAPALMLQMGLLGLVYAYRHPASSFAER